MQNCTYYNTQELLQIQHTNKIKNAEGYPWENGIIFYTNSALR